MPAIPRKPAVMRERPQPPYWWESKTAVRGVTEIRFCCPSGHVGILPWGSVVKDGTVSGEVACPNGEWRVPEAVLADYAKWVRR